MSYTCLVFSSVLVLLTTIRSYLFQPKQTEFWHCSQLKVPDVRRTLSWCRHSTGPPNVLPGTSVFCLQCGQFILKRRIRPGGQNDGHNEDSNTKMKNGSSKGKDTSGYTTPAMETLPLQPCCSKTEPWRDYPHLQIALDVINFCESVLLPWIF